MIYAAEGIHNDPNYFNKKTIKNYPESTKVYCSQLMINWFEQQN